MKPEYFLKSLGLLLTLSVVLVGCTGLQQWRSAQQEKCAENSPWSSECLMAEAHGTTGIIAVGAYAISKCFEGGEERVRVREAQLQALDKACDREGFWSKACSERRNCVASVPTSVCASTLFPPESFATGAVEHRFETGEEECVDPVVGECRKSPDKHHHFFAINDPPKYWYKTNKNGGCWKQLQVDCQYCGTTGYNARRIPVSFEELTRVGFASGGQWFGTLTDAEVSADKLRIDPCTGPIN